MGSLSYRYNYKSLAQLLSYDFFILCGAFYFLVGLTAGFTQRATLDPDLNEIHVLAVSIIPCSF